MAMNGGGLPPGSWPGSPSKSNTNPEPPDETLRLFHSEGDGLRRQELTEDTQKPSEGNGTWKEHKVAMLPPEIIER